MSTLAARILAHLDLLRSRSRVALARASGVKIGPGAHFAAGSDVRLGVAGFRSGTIAIGPRAHLEQGVVLHPYGGAITLGSDIHLGPGTVIYGHGSVTIGDDCIIAMHCRILSSEHAIIATDRRTRSEPDVLKATRLGHDVWLGAGVTVLGGVSVGDGCIVGAGAVVTRDLPPYSIAMGVPARVTGHR